MIDWERYSAWFLVLGLLIFSLGIFSYFSTGSNNNMSRKQTSITERDVAMAEARSNGQKEYSFTTGFIPGIGIITDPEAYKKTWEESSKKEPSN